MGVYVDALIQHDATAVAPAARLVSHRNGHRWCHMIADTEAELHALASRIGLSRAWFQGDHYDLTPGRRATAIRGGAIPLDRRAFGEKLRDYLVDSALTKYGASAPARRVYVALSRCLEGDGRAELSTAALEAATGLPSSYLTIAIEDLELAGLIRIEAADTSMFRLLGPTRRWRRRAVTCW